MTEEKHIIKKAVVELHIPSATNAMDLQNKTMVFFREKICPMIEKIVGMYADTAETIRIDKLELDLTGFKPGESNDAALRRLEEQVEKKIIQLVSEERAANFAGEIVTAVKKIPKEKADEELLIYLLVNGNLPWWAKTEQSVSLEKLVQKILQQPSASFKKELRAAVTLAVVRKRIAYQLPAALIEKIISLVADQPVDELNHLHILLAAVKESGFASGNMLPFVYEYALMYTVAGGILGLPFRTETSASSLFVSSPSALRTFITGFIKEKNDLAFAEKLYRQGISGLPAKTGLIIKEALAESNDYFEGAIKKIFDVADVKLFFEIKGSKQVEQQSAEQKAKRDAEKEAEKEREKRKEKENENEKESENEGKIKTAAGKNKEQAAGTEPTDAAEKEKREKDPETFAPLPEKEDEYFIKNSGLIIISPYLPAFFKELELCDGKAFVSEEARERAVFLLQYLTTGDEENFEEHEMTLNKVLCNMEISTPLTLQFRITEKEKEESLGLLQAVADNWPALKGTSGTGMRDAFFMRDGILEQQSNGWNLKIEKTTIDILLDKLPWGLSILQLPWSKEMIFVS